jgi:hypothetical protein
MACMLLLLLLLLLLLSSQPNCHLTAARERKGAPHAGTKVLTTKVERKNTGIFCQ